MALLVFYDIILEGSLQFIKNKRYNRSKNFFGDICFNVLTKINTNFKSWVFKNSESIISLHYIHVGGQVKVGHRHKETLLLESSGAVVWCPLSPRARRHQNLRPPHTIKQLVQENFFINLKYVQSLNINRHCSISVRRQLVRHFYAQVLAKYLEQYNLEKSATT